MFSKHHFITKLKVKQIFQIWLFAVSIRLTGERGIPILPKLFENVKYKGKGHEVEDLNKMMAKMEHWAHRLFPKLPFDQLIERVERLGQKKPVQVNYFVIL